MSRPFIAHTLLIALPLAGASTANAASFLYEGFGTSPAPAPADQYEAGAVLSANPGQGSGPWTSAWSDTEYTTETGSLIVPGLAQDPGKLTTITTGNGSQRTFDSDGFAALGNEVWFSFAFSRGPHQKRLNLTFAERESLNRGITVAVEANGTDLYAQIDTTQPGGEIRSAGSATVIQDQVHFVIGRITFDAGAPLDRLDVWFDPTPTHVVADLGAPTLFVEADWTGTQGDSHGPIDRLALGDGTSIVLFDEIRVGASLTDAVALVPEPASATLALLGAALGAGVRRRSRS